jgi:beta-lactamase regulating signal transducer with metallopeptidase domain
MIPVGDELPWAAWAQLWQVTLLIAAVALLTRLFARNRPHLAHALWLVVLLKCVTPPLWSSPSGVFCWIQAMPRGESSKALAVACVGPKEHLPVHLPALALSGDEEGIGLTANEPTKLATILGTAERSEPAEPATRGVQPHRSGPNGKAWTAAALFGAWVLGSLGILAFALWRWARCMRLIRRARYETGDSYQLLMARLSRRLGLRQPARLIITASRVGPAVMGLLRPTVLLPKTILRGKSEEDLEPLLAHELIHIRRGDLWVGSLQVLAQAVWWFHPLVWWAGQRTSREAERCCDEAVIAEFGYRPARYARALLDVLERRRMLQPLPALPGVRPVEVTSRRLERIMKLGQGSRRRSPWWCWVVMLAVAVLTLPGAALVVAAADGQESAAASGEDGIPPLPLAAVEETSERQWDPLSALRTTWANLTGTLEDPRLLQASGQEASPASGPEHPAVYPGASPMFLPSPGARLRKAPAHATGQTTQVYEVDDVLAALRSDLGVDEERARAILMKWLAGPVRTEPVAGNSIGWSDRGLEVQAGPAAQTLVAMWLEAMRTCGVAQIRIEAHFITGPAKTLDSVGENWTILHAEVPPAETPDAALVPPRPIDRPSAGEPLVHQNRSQTVVERNLPVMFEVLDDDRAEALLERLHADRRAKELIAPKIIVFSGQSAFLSDSSQSPFVVGIKDGQPQIRVVRDGVTMCLRPLLQDDDMLELGCQLTLSSIRDVEVFEFEQAGGKPARIQIPEVETTRWEASVQMPVGKTLLIGGLKKRDKDGEPQPLLVMLRADKVKPRLATANEPKMHTRVYSVGGLIKPPERVVIQAGYQEPSAPAPAEVSVDFDPLTELITATVAPETWEDMGGWGSIKPFPGNLSLVVSQTQEVHDQIADLLEQLRRAQNVQILLETEVVCAQEGVLQRLGYHFVSGDYAPLTPDQTRRLRGGIQTSDQASARRLPRATLFDGQIAEMVISPEAERQRDGAGMLSLQGVVSNDRRSVRLKFTHLDWVFGAQSDGRTALVQDGHSLLVDVTGLLPAADRHVGVPVAPGSRMFRRVPSERSTERTLVLITPQIVTQEEEEKQLGIIGTP